MDVRRTHVPAVALGEHRVWMQRVGGLTALPNLIRQLGGEPHAVMAQCGLDESSLRHADNAVPYSAVVDLLDRAADQTRCRHFGLLVGRMWTLADLGVVGTILRHSSSVGRALDAFTVYQHLNSQGGLAFLLRRGDFVDFGYAMYHPSDHGSPQVHDTALAVAMNIMTELCGAQWTPYEVLLSHAKPSDVAQYRAFFKVMPRFDAEFSALRFHARDLALPIPGADPESFRRADRLARTAGHPDFLQQVYRGLRQLLLESRHSGDDLAQVLAMHRRTLNRRLKDHGTTFQHVLDSVRFDIARDLLSNSNLHLDDVAATLGYAAVTPFMRTFRRWSGTTPGQWRRTMRGEASEATHRPH